MDDAKLTVQVIKTYQNRLAYSLHPIKPNAFVPVVLYQLEQAISEELKDETDVLPVRSRVLEVIYQLDDTFAIRWIPLCDFRQELDFMKSSLRKLGRTLLDLEGHVFLQKKRVQFVTTMFNSFCSIS
jgi:hypothetical protein